MAGHTFNPSAIFVSSRPLEIHSETLSQRPKGNKGKEKQAKTDIQTVIRQIRLNAIYSVKMQFYRDDFYVYIG